MQAGAEFEGRFKRFTPEIRFDPADLAGSRFLVEIDTRSADTQDGDRDAALRVMRAAYDALPDDMKARLEGLRD